MVPAMKTALDIAGPTDLNIPFSLNCNSVVILTMYGLILWSEIKITLLTLHIKVLTNQGVDTSRCWHIKVLTYQGVDISRC